MIDWEKFYEERKHEDIKTLLNYAFIIGENSRIFDICQTLKKGDKSIEITDMMDYSYLKGRQERIDLYMLKAHNRIMYELCDLLADLNKEEIMSHDDIDEWLGVWKKEVDEIVLKALIKTKHEG